MQKLNVKLKNKWREFLLGFLIMVIALLFFGIIPSRPFASVKQINLKYKAREARNKEILDSLSGVIYSLTDSINKKYDYALSVEISGQINYKDKRKNNTVKHVKILSNISDNSLDESLDLLDSNLRN
jgi:hypothetical protein